jgi:hypothetical protein
MGVPTTKSMPDYAVGTGARRVILALLNFGGRISATAEIPSWWRQDRN